MSENWAVGDLAVCVDDGQISCGCGKKHNNSEGRCVAGRTSKVAKIVEARNISVKCAISGCCCETLVLDNGTAGLSIRFRKVKPDSHEGSADDWALILETTKRKVRA